MSELEDRPHTAPAVVAPATLPAPVPAETADPAAVAPAGTADDMPADVEAGGEAVVAPPVAPALQPASDLDEAGAVDPAPAARGLIADGVAPGADPGRDDDPPLLDDTLEAGIASVFAALYAAAGDDEADEPAELAGPLGEDEAVDGITFRLLGELDRLWHRAA